MSAGASAGRDSTGPEAAGGIKEQIRATAGETVKGFQDNLGGNGIDMNGITNVVE